MIRKTRRSSLMRPTLAMATQSTVGSGSAPQLAGNSGPGRCSTRTVRSPAGVAKVTRSSSCGDEPKVGDPVRTGDRADGDLGRLHGRRVDRPAAVEVERDPARRRAGSRPRPRARPGSARAGSRTGARATLGAKRWPPRCDDCQSGSGESCALQRVEERQAEPRAAGIAAAVGADEEDRPGDGVARARGRGPAAPRASRARWRVAAPPIPRGAARMTVTPSRRSGRRIEEHLARRTRRAHPATRPARPLSATASLPHAPRTSTSSQLAASVAVPASGSPPASEAAAQVHRGRADARHAGSRSASSRPSAGSIPSSAANARYSPSAFAVSRPGRATARSSTFFGVCSSSMNSSTWTS